MTFEEAYAQLEQCAERMASPDVKLEDSIALYEKSVRLIDYCQTCIEQARQKITKLEDSQNARPDAGQTVLEDEAEGAQP